MNPVAVVLLSDTNNSQARVVCSALLESFHDAVSQVEALEEREVCQIPTGRCLGRSLHAEASRVRIITGSNCG